MATIEDVKTEIVRHGDELQQLLDSAGTNMSGGVFNAIASAHASLTHALREVELQQERSKNVPTNHLV